MWILKPQLFYISRQFRVFIICMTTVHHFCFLLLVKRSIILHLCSSKIAWDNYASLQIISEYFPARGRPLNRVKKQSSFVEFGLARNEPPYWIWKLLDPGNEWYNPQCNALKCAVDFNGQPITVNMCEN